MDQCNLDHSQHDVIKKMESQQPHMTGELYNKVQSFLLQEQTQETLNELFHLLKKYDLAPADEQEARNQKINQLISR